MASPGLGGKILRVEVKSWGKAKFEVDVAGETKTYVSSVSEVVGASLVAFFADADVELIPYEDTEVVQRVYAFYVKQPDTKPPKPTKGGWAVARLATQTNPQSGNHVEAFLFRDDPKKDQAFNAFDPLIQHVLLAASHNAARFDVLTAGTTITAVTLRRSDP